MKVATKTTDNITEILYRIIEFTELRRDLLTRNLFDYKQENFRPKDLPVSEFSHSMTEAVTEHLQSQRLMLRDRKNVFFGEQGSFSTIPKIDTEAERLLNTNIKQYLKLQINKLSENLMNNRIAEELLKQAQRPVYL